MHAFLEEALENNPSASFTLPEPPASLAKKPFLHKNAIILGQTHSWGSVWWLTCNWLICIMRVPFLSLLTRAALSTSSTAPWMEMSCIPGVQYAATGHKASTWNICLVQLKNHFQLYLILIHWNEKKPYVAFVDVQVYEQDHSWLEGNNSCPLPRVLLYRPPWTPGEGLHVSLRGVGWGGWLPELLQTPLPPSTPLLSALSGPGVHLVIGGMVGPTAVAEPELQVGSS